MAAMDDPAVGWLEALAQRHLTDLTLPEAARALRALSSCYVERRSQLGAGAALETRGKRVAFALFYGPLHFLVTREIVRAVGEAARLRPREMLDLGCGTGAAGAAWAIEAGRSRIVGSDRNPWAVAEANWTYRTLGLTGRARQADLTRATIRAGAGSAVLLAYLLNELTEHARDRLRDQLLAARRRGARILVIEPIARSVAPWWSAWETSFEHAGGRADEWRFPGHLPQRQRELSHAAGLDTRELTARSLWL
jgi:hypothetical protein